MLNENPVCVVVGAGTKYSSNEAYFGTGSDGEFAPDVRWGLGGALPIQFSLAGYSVVILSRTKQNLIPLCDHIVGELGGSCEIVECDVTDPSSANLAFEKIHATYKSIDVLCYNAGFAKAPDHGSKRVDNPIGGGMVEDIDTDAFASSYALAFVPWSFSYITATPLLSSISPSSPSSISPSSTSPRFPSSPD